MSRPKTAMWTAPTKIIRRGLKRLMSAARGTLRRMVARGLTAPSTPAWAGFRENSALMSGSMMPTERLTSMAAELTAETRPMMTAPRYDTGCSRVLRAFGAVQPVRRPAGYDARQARRLAAGTFARVNQPALIGEHHSLHPVTQLQLVQNVRDVRLDGGLADD